jgi:hypothetical protein
MGAPGNWRRMGETIALVVVIIIAWVMYLIPAVPVSLAVWYFGRRRAQFMWWELSIFILPFIAWLVSFNLAKDKGLSNIVEALILGCTLPLATLLRVAIGKALNRALVAGSLMFAVCIVAILLGTMYPKITFQPFVK